MNRQYVEAAKFFVNDFYSSRVFKNTWVSFDPDRYNTARYLRHYNGKQWLTVVKQPFVSSYLYIRIPIKSVALCDKLNALLFAVQTKGRAVGYTKNFRVQAGKVLFTYTYELGFPDIHDCPEERLVIKPEHILEFNSCTGCFRSLYLNILQAPESGRFGE